MYSHRGIWRIRNAFTDYYNLRQLSAETGAEVYKIQTHKGLSDSKAERL